MLTYSQQSDYPVAKVDVLLLNDDGRILLTRRAVEPFKDSWDIPGGTLEVSDFNAEEGGCREIKEELGVDCKLISLLGVYSRPEYDTRYHIVTFIYVGKINSGELKISKHISEYKWFDVSLLPDNIGFGHALGLNDYKNKRNILKPLKRHIYTEFKNKQIDYYDTRFKDSVRVAAAAIILKNDQILLAKRCREPFNGMWYIPGGHILVGETMEECLEREIKEELGVKCRVGELFNAYSDRGRDPRSASATAFYFTEILSENFESNFEVNDFMYMSIDNVPELGYHQNIIIEDIKDYLRNKNS